MPMVVRILILIVLLVVAPIMAGNCVRQVTSAGAKSLGAEVPFLWVSGQMLLWAGFQLISVPMILLEKRFSQVVYVFAIYMAVLCCCGLACLIFRRKKAGNLHIVAEVAEKKSPSVWWILFAGILAFQLVQAARMTYGDGDDAYYVAVSTITVNADTMYMKLPYTGGATAVDIRHGLAPFPLWIAFLSRMCGIEAVSVAHVAVPLVLIPMTYMIFYEIGKLLFPRNRETLPIFLVFTEILVLFGDTSFYTVENFMIARSRQGKAVFGSVIIPMLLLLLFLLFENHQENRKSGFSYWLLLCSVMVSGCLCTTMGAFLLCLLLGIAGICGAVCYGKWKAFFLQMLCCVPCVCYVLIYLMKTR